MQRSYHEVGYGVLKEAKSMWLKQSGQGNSHRHTNWREERTDVQGLLGPFKDFSSHGRGHCRVLHIGVT